MLFSRSSRATARWLFAPVVLASLLLGACSDDGDTDSGDGGPATSAQADAPTTTGPVNGAEETAAPSGAEGTESTNAEPGAPLDLTPDEARQALADYGLTFTEQQGACLGDAYAAEPDLMTAWIPEYIPERDSAEVNVEILSECLGGLPAAVHALVENFAATGMPPSAATCAEDVLGDLTQEELVDYLSGEEAITGVLNPRLVACAEPEATA